MSKKTTLLYIIENIGYDDASEYLFRQIHELKKEKQHDIYVVEWSRSISEFQSLRDKIINELLDTHFWSLGSQGELQMIESQRDNDIKELINSINPDVIHFMNPPESFEFPINVQSWMYDNQKPWRIVESCHKSTFDANCAKQWEPNSYVLSSLEQIKSQFSQMKAPKELIQFPIEQLESMSPQEILGDFKNSGENIQHIINIGPICPTGNQAYFIKLADLVNQAHPGKYQFHLIGPMAPEHENYWGPIVAALPENVKIWGEQVDVELLRVADIMLQCTIQDLDPLAFRVAMAYGVRIIAYPLRSYREQYTGIFRPLTGNLKIDFDTLIDRLTCACARPKPGAGDNQRFLQQLTNFYKEALDTARIAVEQTPNLWEVTWRNGPRVTNHSNNVIKIEILEGDKEPVYFWLDAGQEWSCELPLGDVQVRATFVDGSEDVWQIDWENEEVAIIIDTESDETALIWHAAIQQWCERVKPARVWVKSHVVDKIAWMAYAHKGPMRPVYENQEWMPDIDVVHILTEQESDAWLGQMAGDQLGIQVAEFPTWLNIPLVDKATDSGYVLINPGEDFDVAWWQEVVEWHLLRGVMVLSNNPVGLIGVKEFTPDFDLYWNHLHWANYYIGVESIESWLFWLGSKNAIIVEDVPSTKLPASHIIRIDKNISIDGIISQLEQMY